MNIGENVYRKGTDSRRHNLALGQYNIQLSKKGAAPWTFPQRVNKFSRRFVELQPTEKDKGRTRLRAFYDLFVRA